MGLMDLFKKKSSGDVAKDRLKLLLVSDRANCSSEMMEMMKKDIIKFQSSMTIQVSMNNNYIKSLHL